MVREQDHEVKGSGFSLADNTEAHVRHLTPGYLRERVDWHDWQQLSNSSVYTSISFQIL